MPKQNACVSKHERERVQVIVSGEIEIADQCDEGRIFSPKALLRLRAQCHCGDWVDVEVAQRVSLRYVGIPRTVRTPHNDVRRMQGTKRRDVPALPIRIFGINRLD